MLNEAWDMNGANMTSKSHWRWTANHMHNGENVVRWVDLRKIKFYLYCKISNKDCLEKYGCIQIILNESSSFQQIIKLISPNRVRFYQKIQLIVCKKLNKKKWDIFNTSLWRNVFLRRQKNKKFSEIYVILPFLKIDGL